MPIAAAERLVLVPGAALEDLPLGELIQGEIPVEKQRGIETAESATAWAQRARAGVETPG